MSESLTVYTSNVERIVCSTDYKQARQGQLAILGCVNKSDLTLVKNWTSLEFEKSYTDNNFLYAIHNMNSLSDLISFPQILTQ